MNEALKERPSSIDEEAEADFIDALEAELDSLDPRAQDTRTRDQRDRLYRELFEARGKRIERRNEENWNKLEQLVGHKLRR